MFSGTYNAVAGKVKKGTTEIGEVSGTWNQSMSYKSKVCLWRQYEGVNYMLNVFLPANGEVGSAL